MLPMAREKLTSMQLAGILKTLDATIAQAEQLRVQLGHTIGRPRAARPTVVRVPLPSARRRTGPVARTSPKR